jgi:hypothetical protein
MIRASRLKYLDRSHRVDVTGDEVPAHAATVGKASLKVHQAPRNQRGETRHPPGLGKQVKLEHTPLARRYGQAAAIHRDRVTESETVEHSLSLDAQHVLPAIRGKLHHPTGFLDKSREHVN